MPSRSANNHRYVPDAVRDYDLNPAASVVDKQSKYTPQIEDAARLKHTAQGLSNFARGLNNANYVLEKQANENMAVAHAKTEEKNRDKCNEVFNKLDGMAKFNPYNKDAYQTLRAKANYEEGVYDFAKLESSYQDLTYEEFTNQKNQILTNTINKMSSEGLKSKHTAKYLTNLQNQSTTLTQKFVNQKADQEYKILQNQMVSSTSKDIATLTYLNPNGYIDGWNEAVKRLEEVADSVGMDSTKKKDLLDKTINQYLVDNVDDIDAEEFMVAIGQTKIGGKPLSDFDPNYATTMKQMLIKAKGAKLEADTLDLKIEKLRLEKATLAANKEMFEFLSDPSKTDAEILNKANELIKVYGMEAIGMDYLQSLVKDKQTLFNVRTTQTNPQVYDSLMEKFVARSLTQEDIITAAKNKQLGAKDAYSLLNALDSDYKEVYSAQLRELNDFYLGDNPQMELGTTDRNELSQSVYTVTTDPNLSHSEKAQALKRIKSVAEYKYAQKKFNESKDPNKLLTASYMRTQKVSTHSKQDVQRALAQLGFFRNQLGWQDANIEISSLMQQDRMVTIKDDKGREKTVNRPHRGTDVSTYAGRQIVAPMSGTVVASGYESSMGNYVLFECKNGGYIKLMHLQRANLPAVGTRIAEGRPMGHVGNTGDVEPEVRKKNIGVLHIECFDRQMRLVDPVKFIKGK